MAEQGRRDSEKSIEKILTEYARKIRSLEKSEYPTEIQQLFGSRMDAFYKLVTSEELNCSKI